MKHLISQIYEDEILSMMANSASWLPPDCGYLPLLLLNSLNPRELKSHDHAHTHHNKLICKTHLFLVMKAFQVIVS